jgi:hypothetical protein
MRDEKNGNDGTAWNAQCAPAGIFYGGYLFVAWRGARGTGGRKKRAVQRNDFNVGVLRWN